MLKRRVNIRVENHTNVKWTAINAAFSSGTSDTFLPDEIAPSGAVQFLGVQRSFSIFTGTAGVFTYSILSEDGSPWKTLAVMWTVPFDYNIWRSNFWNVKVYDTKEMLATRVVFKQMWRREGEPVKGEDNWKEFKLNDEFTAKGCMTSNSNSKLIIKVYENSS